jgi:membrane protein implicated in regulation of membrane protease activity
MAVIANLVALMLGTQAVWVGLLALFPLILLLLTGLYLFVLPYIVKWRGGAESDDEHEESGNEREDEQRGREGKGSRFALPTD